MTNSIDVLQLISTVLSFVALIISIISLLNTKYKPNNHTKLYIEVDGTPHVIEGSKKEVEKHIEQISNTLLNNNRESEFKENPQKAKSLEDIGNDPEFAKKIDNLKNIISSLIGTDKIWFTISVIEGEMVKTVFSSRNQIGSNNKGEKKYLLTDQLAFNKIANGNEFFFSSNMLEYEKEYNHSNPNWQHEYISCIVVPIITDKKLQGFFCMYGLEALKKIDASATVLSLMKKAEKYIESMIK